VDFDVRSEAADLMHIARIGALARGAAALRVFGKMDLAQRRVDATVAAEASDLASGKATLDRASVDAHVKGPVSAPTVDAIALLTRNQATLKARLTGLHFGDGVVDVPELVVEGQGEPVRARARVAPGRVMVDVEAPDVDLTQLAKFAGEEANLRGGHVALVAR